MLKGRFENCYGLKHFDLGEICFQECNKAIIYAPNGVMKSSLAKVFEDISRGDITEDRIFKDRISSYSIDYHNLHFEFCSSNPNTSPSPDNARVYVINSFTDSFEFTKESVSTLLADTETRSQYDQIMAEFADEVKQIETELRQLSGIQKKDIKPTLIDDFKLSDTSDWPDILEMINDSFHEYQPLTFSTEFKYSELFNDKVLAVYSKRDFRDSINEYISSLKRLLENNPLLSNNFTDRDVESLSKAFEKNNLFNAQHTIRLKGNTEEIHSIDRWNEVVKTELNKLYNAPELSSIFQKLKKMLTANAEVSRLREIILSCPDIIPYFEDVDALKKRLWHGYFDRMESPFNGYYQRISHFKEQIRNLYDKAADQSPRWELIVQEFNRRFRIPFEIVIENKANFLLKDEVPNFSFKYSSGNDNQESASLSKDELMLSFSTGERRALYLLYVLFDLEDIRKQNISNGEHSLIIADDIADSFDYKNKYAIVEYLHDLSSIRGIDMLILTHNFDFYRTVKRRLGIQRSNCFIAQRNNDGIISMTEFTYQNDFFRCVVVAGLKDGRITTDKKKKLLFSSIPFYRNLCEYSGEDDDYLKLTCFLHIKSSPLDTASAKLSDLWSIVNPYLKNAPFIGDDEPYLQALDRIANQCIADIKNEVLLDNKLVVAISIRLKAELFLKNIIMEKRQLCEDASSNQLRRWFEKASSYLSDAQKATIEEVNLMTPESIHLNSFMYEPLIDLSDHIAQ